MIGFFVGAGILGIIIIVMEEDFPGWDKMILCVLAGAIPAVIINLMLPPEASLVGFVVGAVCAGFAIAATCGMSVKRACIAATTYFVIEAVIWAFFYSASR